jgi:separase
MSEAEELSVAKLVSECLDELVQMAQSRTSFMEDKSFVLLCETWTSFAKRVRRNFSIADIMWP